jgi:hypothetical protein
MQLTQFNVSGNVLTLKIHSEVDDQRFKAICKDMDKAFAALGKLRLVLVIRHYPAFNSAESLYEDLRFLRLYDHAIEKVAVVCDRFWKDSWVGLFSLFSGIPMDFFEMTQMQELSRWVQGA